MADTRTLSCSSLSELPEFAQSAKLVVPLQSDVVYVTGTVNAVPTTWTRGDGDAWTTTADRSADDVYRVELEMITAAGRTYTAAVTLYYGLLNLITDRTQADADEVKRLAAKGYAAMTTEEKAAWDAGRPQPRRERRRVRRRQADGRGVWDRRKPARRLDGGRDTRRRGGGRVSRLRRGRARGACRRTPRPSRAAGGYGQADLRRGQRHRAGAA